MNGLVERIHRGAHELKDKLAPPHNWLHKLHYKFLSVVILQEISNPPAQQDTKYDNAVTKFSRNDITFMVIHVLQAGPLQGLEF